MSTVEEVVTDHGGDLVEQATATFNVTRTHRYELTRVWDDRLPVIVLLMLNPSVADAFRLDNTIRRGIGFAKREGCGSLTALNLFAYRSTDPHALRTCPDPVGPRNDEFILKNTSQAEIVVAAWGVHGALNGRAQQVTELLDGVDLYCLGTTKAGAPRHPLYISNIAPLKRWSNDDTKGEES